MLRPVVPDAYKLAWESNVNFSCAWLVEQGGNFGTAFFCVVRELPVA